MVAQNGWAELWSTFSGGWRPAITEGSICHGSVVTAQLRSRFSNCQAVRAAFSSRVNRSLPRAVR